MSRATIGVFEVFENRLRLAFLDIISASDGQTDRQTCTAAQSALYCATRWKSNIS